jgi:hypothetical protein
MELTHRPSYPRTNGGNTAMTDPMDLLSRARAIRGLADQSRIASRTSSSDEDQKTFADHATVLDRDAERLESLAFTLVERQRWARSSGWQPICGTVV